MVMTPRGPAASMTPLQTNIYGGGYSQNIRVNMEASLGINRGGGADWFGPQNPMAPTAPLEVAGRAWNFAPGYNLNQQPRSYEAVTFGMMKQLADGYDLMRLVIETRKDQIAKLKWKFRAKADADPKTKDKTTPDQQNRIDYLTSFFTKPDGVNRWRPWLRSLLEDKFVLDAATLYLRRNRGGQLIALEQIDGATIKVVLDDWGRTPMPYMIGGQIFYPPAYQQQLAGLPAVNYTVKDIIYRPYNKRVARAYGYSEVEQVITTVHIAMRRQQFQLSYYTEGNIPEALIGTPENWTPEQIVAFQTAWDALFTGNAASRRHAKFVPGGVAKTFVPTKEPDLKNPMDDWLARIVCFAFSISPQQLITMMNRATAESGATQAKEEGTEPLKEWVAEIINDVLETEFNSPDIEFAWDDAPVVDEAQQTEIITKKVEGGLLTINRGREIMGEDPSDDPGADVLMVKTASGFVPVGANTIDGKKEAISAGIVPDPLAPPVLPPGAGGPDDKTPPGKGGGGKAPPGKSGATSPGDAGKAPAVSKFERAHGVHKAFEADDGVKPVPFDFPASAKQEAKLARLLARAFRKVRAGVVRQVLAASEIVKAADGGLAKAGSGPRTPDDIARDADLSAIEEIIASAADALGESAEAVATEVMARIGVNSADELVDVVNERAVAKARDIAAEMVGMRWNADGDLVEAVRPEWRIDTTTRNMIRDVIEGGLRDNVGNKEIAALIRTATAFSEERAALIAHTEINRVNSMASLESYRGARDELDLDIKKEWLLGEKPCEICIANNDQGAIDLDEDFQSGDPAPPAHPNCECAVAPVMGSTRKLLKYSPPASREKEPTG